MSAQPMPGGLFGVPGQTRSTSLLDDYRRQMAWSNLSRIGQGLLAASAQGMPVGQGLALGLSQAQMPDPIQMWQLSTAMKDREQQEAQQTARSKLLGGYDPQTGITWNQGRPGLLGSPQSTGLLAQAYPEAFGGAVMSQMFPKPQEPTGAQKDAAALGLKKGTPEYDKYIRDRTLKSGVTVNIGDKLPPPPKGFYYKRADPQNPELARTPGGPAALEQKAAEEAKAAGERQKRTYADIVTEDIDRTLDLVGEGFPITGIFSTAAQFPGTKAHDAAKLIATVRANVGFDKLQEMRAASPTGGALGQVSENENALLQAAIGNLELSQSADQLKHNLERVKEIYLDIIHGPGNRPSQTYTPDEFSNMSDEEFKRLLE